MPSLLEFSNSSLFRKKLLTRNLPYYLKTPTAGSLPRRIQNPLPPLDFQYVQSDSAVIDSPDILIDEPSFANKLYPLNQYGSEGGYKQVPDPTGLLNKKSNEGEYGYQDADLVTQGPIASTKGFPGLAPPWKPLNVYSNGAELQLDAANFIDTLEKPAGYQSTQNNQPYPSTFVPSTYRSVSILLSKDPQGTNGLLSQDSFIQRLGAETLRKEFEARIATQIRQDTLGRANIFNATSGTDILNIVTGIVPVIEPNYTITITQNPILAATNFALRLAGSVSPVSPIPGSYWDPNINPPNSTTLQQLGNAYRRSAVGKFISNLLGGTQTGSQIMFNNLGAGQKSRLFVNIDYNRYKPNLPRTFFDRVRGELTGSQADNSNYYIGSITSEPSRVFSPSDALPNDTFGREQQTPVYGPSELAQLYEGPSREIKLGANGPTYSDGGGVEGGLTWVSPKYKGNAGKKVGLGGEVTEEDENFRPSSYNSTESTNITFKQGSILDDTQRLIDSQPQGGKRLQHVGNAIDQVSKVFHDGYKEMTKGSRVYRYIGAIGQEVGTEYCRVFAKDIPYLNYNNLQKTDGITVNGRRFSDSVLDSTYNLNIVPNKQEGGQASSNLIGTMNNAYAKKYMFSLENLAWRTSSTPGYSVSDLAVCERGPNGGRVMWFPPYGLTFTESVSTGWQQNDFIGRPEPIYTYKNTSRTGSLNWKIVVDHPSVLNIIVNKVLGNETNRVRVNSIIESFMAGCRKYDLYELAKKYYTVNPNDLYQLQEVISSKEVSREQIIWAKQEIQTGVNTPDGSSTTVSPPTQKEIANPFEKYKQLGFYFANDYPKKNEAVTDYTSQYSIYVGQKPLYKKKGSSLEQFFDTVITPNYDVSKKLITELSNQLKQYQGTITLVIDSSCSAPATKTYNQELSKRRIESTIKYFVDNPELKQFITQQRLIIKEGNAAGETTSSNPLVSSVATNSTVDNLKASDKTYNCTDNDVNAVGGDTQAGSKDVYTVPAMACRRAFISSIETKLTELVTPPTPKVEEKPQYEQVLVGKTVVGTVKETTVNKEWRPRDNITKRVLRSLLTECDYFEVIKQDTPMVFDNLKDKLKYFHPTFHSMTPEGLNTRLTFLQQCMRPGDTIPTIKQVGESTVLQYNNATNTAFGAPPVLVLRIGDFYNTKIIPDSLSLQYENLDLNPEGIGIQPMICNVTLNFKFVGGSGLKESVDKLQNALTFNFYANTEIYDDRADVTAQEEFLKVLDAEFLALAPPPGAPAINQAPVYNGQNNNSTIGVIKNKTIDENGENGTISYTEFMKNLVYATQTYFQNVVNKNLEVVNQYNNAVRQQWMYERNYTMGFLLADDTVDFEIFGKPNNFQNRFNVIFKTLITNIKDEEEGFIQFIKSPDLQLSTRMITTIKNNYVNYLNNKLGSFQNALTKITQDLVNFEQSYIQELARANIIIFDGDPDTGTDGYQQKNGTAVVYVTSGITEGASDSLKILSDDLKKISNDVVEFNETTQSENSFNFQSSTYEGTLVLKVSNGKYTNKDINDNTVFVPFSNNEQFKNLIFRRVYMIVSDEILDDKKYETFKNALIGNTINNKAINQDRKDNISEVFDDYWKVKVKPIFEEENNITKAFIDDLSKTKLKKYLIYTPFDNKERLLSFTSKEVSTPQKKEAQEGLIKYLASTSNLNNNNKKWNDEFKISAYVSKAKLN